MLGVDYLIKGVTGMSRAPQVEFNAGHWGAAVVAAYFFSVENELPADVETAYRKQVDKLIGKFSDLFVPLPKEKADPGLVAQIDQAVTKDISHLHAIGHNVIFGTLAMRALREVPELSTPSVVSGICTLIELLNARGVGNGTPGWEKSEVENIAILPEDNFPRYENELALIRFAFESFLKTRVICRGGHAGVVGHLLTHADALTELSRMGYPEMAARGYSAYQIHAKLVIRPFDPEKYGEVPRTPAKYSPLTLEYWEEDLEGNNWAYGHYFKYPYSFYRMLKRADHQENLVALHEKFAVLM